MAGTRADAGSVTITFGPGVCGNLEESAKREWLVTDGLGGYAMGTVAGLRTRRYHGLLAVAVDGPGARMIGLARPRPGARRRRRPLPARHRRVGGRDGRPARARAARPLRARPRRSALALAGRGHRRRARAGHGPRPGGGRRRPPADPQRPAGAARADPALHLAQRPRRAVRRRRPEDRGDRRRLRLRGRLPRGRPRVGARRRVVSRRPVAGGGGPRSERPRGRLGRRHVRRRPRARAGARGHRGRGAVRRRSPARARRSCSRRASARGPPRGGRAGHGETSTAARAGGRPVRDRRRRPARRRSPATPGSASGRAT